MFKCFNDYGFYLYVLSLFVLLLHGLILRIFERGILCIQK